MRSRFRSAAATTPAPSNDRSLQAILKAGQRSVRLGQVLRLGPLFTVLGSFLAVPGAGAWAGPAEGSNAQSHEEGDAKLWRVTVGGGVVSMPRFPGSDSHKVSVLPRVGASYGRFFIGGEPGAGSLAGLGVNLYRDARWRFSAAVSAGLARRREIEDPRLSGLGDVKRTVSGGLAVSYSRGWLRARATVASDVAGNKHGTLARLDLSGRYRPNDRWTFSAGPGLTWANARYMQTFYGVDATQSARSGLPGFDARGGLERLRFSAGADYDLNRHWGLGASGWVATLQTDAAASPIVEGARGRFVGAFITYRFGHASVSQ